MSVIGRIEEYVAIARENGMRATFDPRNVNPPTLLFLPAPFTPDVGCGVTVTMQALVLAPGPGNADAWRTLERMAADAAAFLPYERVEPASYSIDGTGDLPAYQLTWTETVDWPSISNKEL